MHSASADEAAAMAADPHDRALLAHVRPPGWTNPTPQGRYHLVVIGGGSGGLVSAAIAASLGARVALVEHARLGGDCLNVGCVPSKALLSAARAWHGVRRAAADGDAPEPDGRAAFARAVQRMRRLRAELAVVDGAARFSDLGVDVYFGTARFVAPDAVTVDGARLDFHRAILATGSRPAVPPIPGLAASGFRTNETIFELDALPARLTVIGGGPVGCELAQAYARFGSEVTLLQRSQRLLPHEEPDASKLLRKSLEADGVRVQLGCDVLSVSREGALRISFRDGDGGHEVAADELLVATGRRVEPGELAPGVAGVEVTDEGIGVDARLRTTNPRVYAVGDCCARQRFTHTADAHARLAVRNALFHGRGRADRLVIPSVTYTSPEIARVGLLPDEAEAARGETLTVPLHEVDRARLDGEDEGFLRISIDGGGRILGATLVAEHAGEVISQVTQAMVTGTPLSALGAMVFPYPTQAEALRKAADRWARRRLTPRARKAFAAYFRVTG